MGEKQNKKSNCAAPSYIGTEDLVDSHLPVKIVEEREQIEAQFTPGLLLAIIEDVGVHHTDRIVHHL